MKAGAASPVRMPAINSTVASLFPVEVTTATDPNGNEDPQDPTDGYTALLSLPVQVKTILESRAGKVLSSRSA